MKRYPLSLLAATAIVVVSLIPVPELPIQDVPLYDKWAHFVMYGVLSLIVWWEYRRGHKDINWGKALILALIAPIVLGGLLELAQSYLTTCRNGDWLDFVANTIGALLGSALAIPYLYLNRESRPSKV